MKKIDFEKMEKIEGGKHLKTPQQTTAKKSQQSEVSGNTPIANNKPSLKI